MKELVLEDIINNNGLREGIIDAIKSGSIFIYPTDTVYGIGCNTELPKSVRTIREIKCTEHPFSVVAPSKEWIKSNLVTNDTHTKYLKKLPGPYTLIFKKKSKNFLKESGPGDSLGVRMPKHPFTNIVTKANVPFVTTSANISGQPTIKSVNDIPEQLGAKVDFVIDGGTLSGNASRVIDLSGESPKILRK